MYGAIHLGNRFTDLLSLSNRFFIGTMFDLRLPNAKRSIYRISDAQQEGVLSSVLQKNMATRALPF